MELKSWGHSLRQHSNNWSTESDLQQAVQKESTSSQMVKFIHELRDNIVLWDLFEPYSEDWSDAYALCWSSTEEWNSSSVNSFE